MTTPAPGNSPTHPEPDAEAQLTAYALGELPPGSAAHTAVEARLKDDPAARAEVASLRATADRLTAALAAEPAPPGSVSHKFRGPGRGWPMRLGVAASLAAAAGLAVAVMHTARVDRQPTSVIDEVSRDGKLLEQLDGLLAGDVTTADGKKPTVVYDTFEPIPDAVGFDATVFNLSESLAGTHRPTATTAPAQVFGDADGDAALETRWRNGNQKDYRGTVTRNDNSTGFAGGEYGGASGDSNQAATDPPSSFDYQSVAGNYGDEGLTQRLVEERSSTSSAAHNQVPAVVREIILEAREQQKQGQAENAIALLDRALFIEPNNLTAHVLKEVVEDSKNVAVEYRQLDRFRNLEQARDRIVNVEAVTPYPDMIRYPENWPEPSDRRLKPIPDSTGLDAEARVWYGHVSPAALAQNQTVGNQTVRPEAITVRKAIDRQQASQETASKLRHPIPADIKLETLESAVDYVSQASGAAMVVRWDRLEEAGIERDLPITLQFDEQRPAGEVLELIFQQASAQCFGEDVGLVIVNGVAQVTTDEGFIDGRFDRLRPVHDFNTEAYDRVEDNPFLAALDNPLSTFSVDVDTASYANVRRFLTQQNMLPPADAVRIEEMVNYFDYGYAPPEVIRFDPLPPGEGGETPERGEPGEGGRVSTAPSEEQAAANRPHPDLLPGGEGANPRLSGAPFAAHVEVAAAPWSTSGGRLVRIGLKGVEVATDDRPAANLVFLLDVSGSMNRSNKLPLVKAGMKKLVENLKMDDRIAIVVYAGASGLVLDSTTDHDAVLDALADLTPGGSTNGAAGIELAYDIAAQNHIPGGLNRVILCTDGDFNVGITDRGALTRLIETKANLPEQPVSLTVLGFGSGNLKDATMEELSNKGDGNYGYVDSQNEAQKLLAEQVNATLLTIAKDVKIQVEFNPRKVAAYRLIGYENRVLAKEDFNNDTVDAGDIGAGHTVTALYEVVPATEARNAERRNAEGDAAVDPLKYQRPAALSDAADSGELLTLKLRYKAPDAPKEQGTSKLLEFPVEDSTQDFRGASEDFRFAASVAGFGMLLRGSPYAGDLDYDRVIEIAERSTADWAENRGELTPDAQRRLEFIQLVDKARALARPAAPAPEAADPAPDEPGDG